MTDVHAPHRTRMALALAAFGGPAARATTVEVNAEACFDLDSGQTVTGGDGCPSDGDVRWTYNSNPPPFVALFWNEEHADVGYVARPYDDVTTLDLPGVALCDFLNAPVPECAPGEHDRPWDPGRTAIVRTGAGALYRVRWLALDLQTLEVTFEYAPVPAAAATPTLRFAQRGRVIGADGRPIEGARDLTVSLHPDAGTSAAVWSKTFAGTVFEGGQFGVTIEGVDGQGRSLDAVATVDLWMSLTIDGAELGARQPVDGAPVAGRAHGAAPAEAGGPCDVVGGLGFDVPSSDLLVCFQGVWRPVARDP